MFKMSSSFLIINAFLDFGISKLQTGGLNITKSSPWKLNFRKQIQTFYTYLHTWVKNLNLPDFFYIFLKLSSERSFSSVPVTTAQKSLAVSETTAESILNSYLHPDQIAKGNSSSHPSSSSGWATDISWGGRTTYAAYRGWKANEWTPDCLAWMSAIFCCMFIIMITNSSLLLG